jgi:hypothetical protein
MTRWVALLCVALSIAAATLAVSSLAREAHRWNLWWELARVEFPEVHGFSSNGGSDPKTRVVAEYSDHIQRVGRQLTGWCRWQFGVGLLMTILAALTALVTSLCGAKADGGLPRRATLVVAIATCCTTVASFGKAYVESQKDVQDRERQVLVSLLNEFLDASARSPKDVAQLAETYEAKLANH